MPAPITTSETQVNTATTGDQFEPTVTAIADGGWIVVWMGRVAIGSETGIFAQRYDSAGMPVGGEFQVNSASADQWEGAPAVAALPDGGWMVVWHASSPHGGPSPEDTLIYMQRFDSAGAAAGEVQVNTPDGYVPGTFPEIAVLADSGWVIVWHAQNLSTDADEDIYAQRYDSTGAALGGEFQINSTAPNAQHFPSITALDDGGWIVTWMSQGQDSSGWGVYAQRYNADGSTAGGETLVSTTTAGDQREPHVALLSDSGWVIVWSSSGQDGSGHGIFAQRFDSSGVAVGGEFQVNTTIANDQLYATVEALSNGGWAVTWLSIGPGFDPYGGRTGNVYLQRYDAAGNPVGGETFVGVASEGSFSNLSTRLAAQPDGTIVVTWGQYGTDGSGYGVFARLFDAPVNVIDGTAGDDVLIGTMGDDTINGFAGNDIIRARAGNDTLNGDDDHDFLIAGDGNDTLNGGNGDDYLRGGEGDDIIDGGAGFDRAAFTVAVNNPAIGETGVQVGATVDLNIQGVAQDTGHGMDTLIGIEHVSGTTYNDVLTGNGGDNWIWGEGGDDILSGGGGNDLIWADAGNSTLDGGTGSDTAGFSGLDSFTSGVTVSLALQGSAQTIATGSSMTLTNFENLSGTVHDDALTGDGADNILAGNSGNDALVGGDGNDTLYGDGIVAPDTHDTGLSGPITTTADVSTLGGASGNDTLEGGAGNDHLDGGAGNDTASYANSVGPVEVFLGAGSADEYAADGVTYLSSDTLVNIENVTGSEFDDFIGGDDGDNVLDGLGGNDFIQGRGGNDTIYGGDGNDTIQGDAGDAFVGPSGNDILYGGNGDDSIRGGLGDDQLFGGDGNDHLRGNAGVDYFDGGSETGDSPTSGYGDRISFFEVRATQGVVADLRTGVISNDGYGNVETMTGIESLGADTAYVDTLYGNDGRNFLWASRGDYLYGFGGDDLLNLNAAGHVDGGAGTDLLTLLTSGHLVPDSNSDGLAEDVGPMPDGWSINLLNGTMFDGYGNAGTVTGIENVDGSELADTIRGDHNNNVLRGLSGDDVVVGNGGDDIVDGGDGSDFLRGDAQNYTGGPFGNDTILGGAGDDHMRGGPGVDYFDGGSDSGGESIYGGIGDRISFYEMAATAGVVADLRTGIISNDGFGNVETMTGVESLGGDTAFVDTFYGNDNRNTLLGGRGDNLYGFGGDDNFSMAVAAGTVDGGDGIDLLQVNSAGGWLLPDADSDGVAEMAAAAGSGWTINLAAGTLLDGYGNAGTVTGVENVDGSELGDTLIGDDNDNVLNGGDGDDTIEGRGGNDALDGGNGTDTVSYANASGPVELDLQSGVAFEYNADETAILGQDTLVNIENGSGSAFNDALSGNSLANVLSGLGGDDFLNGQGGDDIIDGGEGSDTANYGGASGAVVVNLLTGTATGAAGNDTLVSIENLNGSQYADQLTGDGGNNTISGAGGDDLIEGGDGHDHVRGGAGNDSVYGGAGNDLLRGQAGDDLIDGGTGYDRVSYFAGATNGVTVSLMLQGVAQDTGNGWDTLVNVEALSGTPFDDVLTGDNNDNSFLIVGGNDIVSGEGGNDLIEVGAGNHTLSGGSGTDALSLRGNTTDITADGVTVSLLLQGAAQDTEQGLMTLSGFENLSGSLFDDQLVGDSGDNVLAGDEGSDVLVGGSGNDTLLGDGQIRADVPAGAGTSGPTAIFNEVTTIVGSGFGNDTLEGGAGSDTLNGGGGTDTASYEHSAGPVEVNLGAGFADEYDATGTTILSTDTLVNIENAIGSGFDDALVGSNGDNFLSGLGGNDFIAGLQGNDTLDGGDGDDTLSGGQGNDTLDGGIGNDSVNGGQGDDTIFGGDGHDALFAQVGNDTLYGGAGDDFLRADTADGLSPGNDYIDGGTGFDRATFFNTNNGVTVSLLLQGTAQDTGQGMDTLVNIEAISGSVFSDTLIGDDNANWFFIGGAGVDHHTVTSDSISANGGNDLIVAGLGNHIVDGGTGTDTLGFTWVRTEIFGGVTVNLTLQGASQDTGQGSMTIGGFENLSGSMFDDLFVGDTGENLLAGGAGGDTLQGGSGDDVLLGDGEVNMAETNPAGAGPITTFNSRDYSEVDFYDSAGNIVYLFEGQDLYDSEGNLLPRADLVDEFGDPFSRFTLDGVDYDFYTGFATTSDGVAGDDTLEGGAGSDYLDGGGGTDTASYAGNSGLVEVNLQAGVADEYAVGGVTYLSSDTLVNIENVIGSAHDDFIVGDNNANILSGGDGNDQIRGLGGNDTLNGDGGHDFMRGGEDNDTINGGEGDDYLAGDAGDDLLDGGNGYDRVSYAVGTTSGVTVSLMIIGAQATGMGNDTLVNVEHLTGTAFNDTLTGNGGDNWLWGGSDGSGVTGNDIINAGDGNDLVEVGTGTHTLSGGYGNDTLSLFGNSSDITAAGITFDLTLQGAAQNTEQGMMTATGFENVSGSIYGDFIYGDAGANILLGDVGNDTLRGGDGDDHLYGDGRMLVDDHDLGRSGPITLFGDVVDIDPTLVGGEDTLLGGRGDDWLYGGRGNDMLTGNQGVDHFVIEANSGDDVVTDFAVNVDKILFDIFGGPDDFGDLTLTKVGNNTVISWGTSDSLTLNGVKPNQLDSGDFEFGSPAVAASLAHGSSFGGDYDAGSQSAEMAANAYMFG